MVWVYIAAATYIALLGMEMRDVRFCALVIVGGLLLTKAVTLIAGGIDAYALWGVIWAAAAVITSRQMICSALLFASGLCYMVGYLGGFPVGPGSIASMVIDGLGIAALLSLGGQVLANRFGNAGLSDILGMPYPRLLDRI